ncbi:MAG: two-component regulator propeller domain-containing protein, partial [Bacteroidota bacterium]
MSIFPRILLSVAFIFQGSKAYQVIALPSPSEEYVIRTWSINEGLPQSSVGCILQTRDGYLWVGTWNGLARFDGVRFTSFHSGNTPALSGSKINALYEDRQGRLWIGTERGLVEFAGNRFVPVRTDGRARAVNAIVEDAEGTIWVGSDGGLFRVENSTLIFSGTDHRELSSPIELLSLDASRKFWIGQSGRTLVASIRPESVSVDSVLRYVSHVKDDRGRVWFLDRENVLYRMDGTRTRAIHRFAAKPFLWALAGGSIGLCFQDRLVLAGDDGITNIMRVGEVDLRENEVLSEDREGNLWLGRASSGLSRLRKKAVTVLDERSGLSSTTITSVFEDRSGTLWVGTHRKGLNYFRNGQFRKYTDLNVHDDSWIRIVWESSDRSLWVSGPVMGFVQIGPRGGKRYTRGRIHAESSVIDAGENAEGGFWIATYG